MSDRKAVIKDWRKKLPPTPLEAMQAECAVLTARLAAFKLEQVGVRPQIDERALNVKALLSLLLSKGLIAQEEWELALETTRRDELKQIVAQAPQIRDAAEKARIRQMLALQPDVQRITH